MSRLRTETETQLQEAGVWQTELHNGLYPTKVKETQNCARFEVITAVAIDTDVFWDVTPCLGVNRAIYDVSEDLLSLSSVSRIEKSKHKYCIRETAVTSQHTSALAGPRHLSCPTLSDKTCLRQVQCPDLRRSLTKDAKINLTIICDIG
jgi:hypothetical protein